MNSVTIILYQGEQDEPFQMTLHDDGHGILNDHYYNNKVEFLHNISSERIENISKLEHEPVELNTWPQSQVIGHAVNIDKLNTEDAAEINELFWEVNDLLENPVGDPPEDEEPESFLNGDRDEFNQAILYLCYFSHRLGENGKYGYTSFYTKPKEDSYTCDGIHESLLPIVEELYQLFQPSGYTYEYTDQNDGRITSHEISGLGFHATIDEVLEQYPSARERLNIRKDLKTLIEKYNGNSLIVDECLTIE